MQTLVSFLPTFLLATPLLGVGIVGIVLASLRRSQHPRQSLLLIISFGLLIFALLMGYATFPLLPLPQGSMSIVNISALSLVINLLALTLNVVAWIMILIVIFRA